MRRSRQTQIRGPEIVVTSDCSPIRCPGNRASRTTVEPVTMAGGNKAPSTKRRIGVVYKDNEQWTVLYGELKRRQGHPTLTEHLFRIVGEKLPFEALSEVRKHLIRSEE